MYSDSNYKASDFLITGIPFTFVYAIVIIAFNLFVLSNLCLIKNCISTHITI